VLRQALARFTAQLHDVEFAQVERLRCTLHKNSHTQGPHPIGQGLAWSVAGATLTQPARLSLHQADALPFQPDHPYLHATWQAQIGSTPLPLPGKLCTGEGWHLQVTVLSIEQLPADWQAPGQPWRAYLDAAQVGRPHLTTTRAGLHFAPLGMAGQHKLLGNFFTDRKIPPSLRSGWPLLIDSASQSVLWVCGLAIAHQVRITEQTRQVLCIQWLLE
jgi:tRNA(Ile)-lysidine synthetase-like protein